jgi:hypothetical protein
MSWIEYFIFAKLQNQLFAKIISKINISIHCYYYNDSMQSNMYFDEILRFIFVIEKFKILFRTLK